MLFKAMKKVLTPELLDEVFTHPFNRELGNGTLPVNAFRLFLEQDRLYLLDFNRALKHTARRIADEQHQQWFYQLVEENEEFQRYMQGKYFAQPPTASLFQSPRLVTKKIPVIHDYTNHLLINSVQAPVAVAVAGLLPCFYLYSMLGVHMKASLEENNPYHVWISSLSDINFLRSTKNIIQITNDLGKGCNAEEQQKMIEAFVKSTKFEISFWDSICKTSVENQYEGVCAFSI